MSLRRQGAAAVADVAQLRYRRRPSFPVRECRCAFGEQKSSCRHGPYISIEHDHSVWTACSQASPDKSPGQHANEQDLLLP